MAKEQYQVVVITFSNGKQGTFMGKAIITEEEINNGVQALLPIKITEAKDLPPDVNFGKLED